jgi:hypothetical protein
VWWIHNILTIYPSSISGSILSASCADDGGAYQSTSVDLNNHLSNENGNLVENFGEHYIKTCAPQGFELFGSSFFIFAICTQRSGNLISTFYDINNNLLNNNRVLTWNS